MAAYRRFMTHVTSRLIAKNRDQLRNPTLRNRVWAAFLLLLRKNFAASNRRRTRRRRLGG